MNNIRVPKAELEDFRIELSADALRRLRAGLSRIVHSTFQSTELALAVTSVAVGGILTAAYSGVEFAPASLWRVVDHMLPAVAVGGLVAYVLLKCISVALPAARAAALLDLVPIPDDAMPGEIDRLTGQWKLESSTKTSNKKSTGILNFDVTRGRITAAGILYGESEVPIAHISSEVCDYQPETQQFVLVYRLSANNDDGSQLLVRCILNGLVFNTGASDGLLIRGNWFHLEGIASGARPWGNATLSKAPSPAGRAQ